MNPAAAPGAASDMVQMITEHFTKAKSMVFPREVLAGHGVMSRAGDICVSLGLGEKALLVTGGRTSSIAGRRVKRLLERKSIEVRMERTGAATWANLDRLAASASSFSPDMVIGVGGGSKIDLAKMTARRCGASFVSIPTSASHDGISSPVASIKRDGVSCSLDGVMPMAILADTEVISRAPYRMLAAGCADVLSNSTALRDWEIAAEAGRERMSTTAYVLSRYAGESIMRDAGRIRRYDETATWLAVRPIIASGLAMGVAGSSRPASGSEHLFSHALDSLQAGSAMHGEQCGVGAILMTARQGGDWKPIAAALKKLGCPTTARGLGASEEQIVEALLRARDMRERYTVLDRKPLTRRSALALARRTGVI